MSHCAVFAKTIGLNVYLQLPEKLCTSYHYFVIWTSFFCLIKYQFKTLKFRMYQLGVVFR